MFSVILYHFRAPNLSSSPFGKKVSISEEVYLRIYIQAWWQCAPATGICPGQGWSYWGRPGWERAPLATGLLVASYNVYLKETDFSSDCWGSRTMLKVARMKLIAPSLERGPSGSEWATDQCPTQTRPRGWLVTTLATPPTLASPSSTPLAQGTPRAGTATMP